MRIEVQAAAATCLWFAISATPAAAASCTVAAQGVNFGNYDVFALSHLESVGNIRVQCDAATSVEVSLSPGLGDFTARRMSAGADELVYNLYTSSSRTTVWGDGTGGTATVSTDALTADLTLYGTVPARQNARPGLYTDTVVVTITY